MSDPKTTDLTAKQKAFLKSQSQTLEAKLQIGKNGLSDNFVKELDIALERDEIVEVRVGKFVSGESEGRSPSRGDRGVSPMETLAAEAATKSRSTLVGTVGRTALYYRAAKEPKLKLPS